MAVLQVRVTDEELEALKLVAKEAGFDSVSAYVRERIYMRVPAAVADQVNASLGSAKVGVEGRCRRATFHRPGTYCSFCHTTPSKKGE